MDTGIATHSKWIYFEHYPPKPGCKTSLWIVKVKANNTVLGFIRWFGQWRGYAFFPCNATVFEEECLRGIGNFVERVTKEHKNIQNNGKT